MYTFNQFQVETSIYKLYNYFINNPEAAKEGLSEVFKNDVKYKKLFRIEDTALSIAKGVAIGGLVFSLTSFIAGGDILSVGLNTASLVVNSFTKSILNMTRNYTVENGTQKVYDILVEAFSSILSKAEEQELTDDKIHEMTVALVEGERDEKYAYLQSYGKCPILLFTKEHDQGFASDNMYPITDGYLSRMYEIIMNVAYNADLGYEDIIREGHDIIVKYMHITEEPNHSKEELDKVKKEMTNFEEKVARRYR